jgi:multisubunit Na+/H+ antiporter MnhB subunit
VTVGGLDVLLAVALPAIGLAAVVRRDRLQGVMLVFSLGILLAVSWARLGAPDIAMVEAALGAGITGVLFLGALARIPAEGVRHRRTPLAWAGLAAVSVAAVTPAALAILALPRDAEGLLHEVMREIPEAGASHPVTAVLLDFRAYDTLLEIGVLLLAVLGAWAARGAEAGGTLRAASPGPLLSAAVRLLVPLMVVVSGVLLWLGAVAPGGAFQAGTVLGATLVLASITGALRVPPLPAWAARGALALGFAVFLGVGAGAMAIDGEILDYPQEYAGALVLAIEATLTVSIGLILAALAGGVVPSGGTRPAPPEEAR